MKNRCFNGILLATLTAVLPVGAAAAQTPAPQPATQGLGGPVVPGVCLLSREAIFANAKVGKAATARLQQLATEAQAEVDAERKPVEAELKAFQAEADKLKPEQRRTREQALAAKLAPIQAKAQQRSREIEATRVKAMQRIAGELEPVIAQVYKSRNCGLLVDRGTVLGGNMANDLTASVVQALDAKITTLSFNRESLAAASPAAR